MWRGVVSIIALLLMCGASVVFVPILIIPEMGFHSFVPILQPLHQALVCEAGETMEYELVLAEPSNEVRFRCVDAAGRERDVDSLLRRPADYALGIFCLGGLLMLAPLYVAVRQGVRGETGPALQQALQQSYQQMRQMPAAMSDSAALNASGQQQLAALEQLRQQGTITQDAYEIARKQIFDNFRAG